MSISPTPQPVTMTEPVTVILDPRVAYEGFGPDDGMAAQIAARLEDSDALADLADAAEQLDWAYLRSWRAVAKRTHPDVNWDVWAPHHRTAGEAPLLPDVASTEQTAIVAAGQLDAITATLRVDAETLSIGSSRWAVIDDGRMVGSATVPWTVRSIEDRHLDSLASRIADGNHLLRSERSGELRLRLYEPGGDPPTGADCLGYVLEDRGRVIFAGNDFHPSPLHAVDSSRTVEAIAGFLALRPGDTDDEYFAGYTERQHDWVSSDGPDRLHELIAQLHGDTEYTRMMDAEAAARQTLERPAPCAWHVTPTGRSDLPAVTLLADTESNATAQYPAFVSAWIADTGRDIDIDDDLFPTLSSEANDDATHNDRPVISPVRGQHGLDWAVEHVNHWDTAAYIAVDNLPTDTVLDIPATGRATVAIRNSRAVAHAGALVDAHNRSHVTALADSHVEIHPGACVDRRPGSHVELSEAAVHRGSGHGVSGQQRDDIRFRDAATATR